MVNAYYDDTGEEICDDCDVLIPEGAVRFEIMGAIIVCLACRRAREAHQI